MRAVILLLVLITQGLSAQQRPVGAQLGMGKLMPGIDKNQTIPSLAGVPSGTRGTLQLEAVVGPAGSVLHTHVVSSPDTTGALDKAAVAAVQAWKFTPAISGRTPIATLVRLDFDVEPALAAGGSVRAAVRLREVPRELPPNDPSVWAATRAAGPGVQYPRVIREIRPSYTADAMRAKIVGSVELEIVVNGDGIVSAARVTKSLDAKYGLDDAALVAASYWLFEPGRVNGAPVPVKVGLVLEFRLH
jgi:TonB family protein